MTTRFFRLTVLPLAAIGLLLSLSASQLPRTLNLSLPQPAALARVRVEQAFGQIPLYFVENQGQVDAQVAYYVQGRDKTLYFTSQGVTYALTAPLTDTAPARSSPHRAALRPSEEREPPVATQRWAVKLDFLGANPGVRPVGQEVSEAVISYFKGSPEQWQAGLPTYSRILYRDLWPGIDLAYDGTVGRLKYEFLVHPGADPSQIRLAYRGASEVRLNGAGQLEVSTPIGGFTDDTPVAYQEVDGRRVPVSAAYALHDSTEHATRSTQHATRNTVFTSAPTTPRAPSSWTRR